MALVVVAQAEPPENDSFSNATDLESRVSGSLVVDFTEATMEEGEPPLEAFGGTVWHRWQAPEDGYLTLDHDVKWDSFLGEDLSTLEPVKKLAFQGMHSHREGLRVTANRVYWIRLGGVDILGGQVTNFRFWSLVQTGDVGTGPEIVIDEDMFVGTDMVEGGFVKWRAPTAGRLDAFFNDERIRGLAELYTGESEETLVLVPSELGWGEDGKSWIVEEDKEYRLSLGTRGQQLNEEYAGTLIRLQLRKETSNGTASHAVDLLNQAEAKLYYHYGYANDLGEQWWSWTAPGDGWVTLHQGELYNREFQDGPALHVYGGSDEEALDTIIETGFELRPVQFPVESGEVYRVVKTSFWPQRGAVELRWNAESDNDHFETPVDLGSSASASIKGTFERATVESGENYEAEGVLQAGTRWWRWTAPADGSVVLTNHQLNWSTLEVFVGNTLKELESLDSERTSGQSIVQVRSGEVLRIRVTQHKGHKVYLQVPLHFDLALLPKALNDNFAEARDLDHAVDYEQEIHFHNADSEPGEPEGGATLWWNWTPPENGLIRFSIDDNNIRVGLYTGSSVDALTAYPSDFPSDRAAYVKKGDSLRIQLRQPLGYSAAGALTFALGFVMAPANDSFANAITIPALDTPIASVMTAAGTESDEPPKHKSSSVWFQWQAEEDGKYLVETIDSTPAVEIYSGGDLANLTEEGFEDDDGNRLFLAKSGVRYWIAAHDTLGFSDYSFSIQISSLPLNDAFSEAIDLGGQPQVAQTYNLGKASVEPNEPWISEHGRSLWWKWTAPEGSIARISGHGQVVFTVFEGPQLDALTNVGRNLGSTEFNAVKDITYYLRASSVDWFEEDTFLLNGTSSTEGYEAWIESRFPDAPESRDETSDPDGDGFTNLAEYVLGGDPEHPDAALTNIQVDETGRVALSCRERVDTSTRVRILGSSDLKSWAYVAMDTLTEERTLEVGNKFESVIWSLTIKGNERDRFYRIAVDR